MNARRRSAHKPNVRGQPQRGSARALEERVQRLRTLRAPKGSVLTARTQYMRRLTTLQQKQAAGRLDQRCRAPSLRHVQRRRLARASTRRLNERKRAQRAQPLWDTEARAGLQMAAALAIERLNSSKVRSVRIAVDQYWTAPYKSNLGEHHSCAMLHSLHSYHPASGDLLAPRQGVRSAFPARRPRRGAWPTATISIPPFVSPWPKITSDYTLWQTVSHTI